MMAVNCVFENSSKYPTELKWASPNASSYMCKVCNEDISVFNDEIKCFVGKHDTYYRYDNKNVISIEFRNTTFQRFPRNINIIFPQLTHLYISDCGLKEISKKCLIRYVTLTTLCIDSNPITTLPKDLLQDMSCLRVITFHDNKLEFVDSQMLYAIKNNQLMHVDFRGNPTINEYYSWDCPEGSVSLAQLISAIDVNCKKPKGHFQLNAASDFFLQGHEELWTTGRLSDITIVTDSKEFKVHRTILATRSSVFAAMFESQMMEQRDNKIIIEEFGSKDIENFLKFFYFGCVESSINVVEVFKLAEKYHVKDLKMFCVDLLLETLEESNASEILELGQLYDNNELKIAAFQKIKDALPEKIFQSGWIDEPERLRKIIDTKLLLDSLFRENFSDA